MDFVEKVSFTEATRSLEIAKGVKEYCPPGFKIIAGRGSCPVRTQAGPRFVKQRNIQSATSLYKWSGTIPRNIFEMLQADLTVNDIEEF